ncbi:MULTISPECIES: DUF2946 domain-containing protein [unclassified Herbaspirillum]|uniref:DUF2946 domain-containing protein n=1 Tax=unclassified Herbaspirillum TaxID=2624150 RepID=UPI000E2E91F5|nr:MULTISPECIES: DUF2946 domain-containing protein [unclassified Herbaspirillum]RFB69878.1 DUF2946 domain-containing protein [Herbaspirillum sp. 3R-3a1]TFI07058.1 DUF2946 domain-containing protein [Herbaspirillum sp. 3R11]TFI12996.1 DUF2946 domain-containing protein [Herbaspirillum sp. 3R-11]TFI27039.1 DUF2946 domain-containing protein [Herbaspirillum sp. 3C11]
MGKQTSGRSSPSIRNTITAWTAILAVLLMVLAPTFSAASQAWSQERGGSFWMEICSAFGDKTANDADRDTGKKEASSSHCPYCLMHADAVAPPRQPMPTETVFTISHFLPRLFYRAPQPLFAWTVALSRAPPLVA